MFHQYFRQWLHKSCSPSTFKSWLNPVKSQFFRVESPWFDGQSGTHHAATTPERRCRRSTRAGRAVAKMWDLTMKNGGLSVKQ
jgi:hypothetical protein